MSNKQTEQFLETRQEAWEEVDRELHEEAGLVFSGKNFEGESEWIGTDREWRKFNQLTQ